MPTHTIRIWDLPTRLFHWLLAASVVALVVTAKVGGNAMVWHLRLGYVVLALLAFGSGPVRGFAVVHCIGILTSMFSAVFFSRGLVNLWYGRQKKLKSVSIGTVWKPEAGTDVAKTN